MDDKALEFHKKALKEGFQKLLDKYYIRQFSPQLFIDNICETNIEKDSFRQPQVVKNIIEFKNLILGDVQNLIESGNLDEIIKKLGSDETIESIKISSPLIKKLNSFRDEIAAATKGRSGSKITKLYTGLISEIQKLVKRHAENKNKYESGKAISNIVELPEVSSSLVQIERDGHLFYVALKDFIKWQETGIVPSRRLLKLTKEIEDEIKKNKIRLLSENEAVDIQNKTLYSKPLEKDEDLTEDLGQPISNKEDQKNFLKNTIKSNYQKHMISKSLLEKEYMDAINLQNKYNFEKKELSKIERPGSQIIKEITQKYVDARNKAKEIESKLQEVLLKISEIHSKFSHLLEE